MELVSGQGEIHSTIIPQSLELETSQPQRSHALSISPRPGSGANPPHARAWTSPYVH